MPTVGKEGAGKEMRVVNVLDLYLLFDFLPE